MFILVRVAIFKHPICCTMTFNVFPHIVTKRGVLVADRTECLVREGIEVLDACHFSVAVDENNMAYISLFVYIKVNNNAEIAKKG